MPLVTSCGRGPSAMSGETNRLLGLAKEISPDADARELDMLAATGEQASSSLLAMALMAQGVAARSYTGWQVPCGPTRRSPGPESGQSTMPAYAATLTLAASSL